MIEETGLWLEQRPHDTVLVVAATKQTADQMMRWIWDRIRWKRILREGVVTIKTQNRIDFAGGGSLQVVSANPATARGRSVNQIFAEDRVEHEKLEAFFPCEWKYSWR